MSEPQILLTGAGKAFCTGGNLREFADGTAQAFPTEGTRGRPPMCRAVLAIHEMEKPVIASVNGMAAGGGCNLALDYELYVLEVLRKSGDVAKGITAFLEKRDPRFEGR